MKRTELNLRLVWLNFPPGGTSIAAIHGPRGKPGQTVCLGEQCEVVNKTGIVDTDL